MRITQASSETKRTFFVFICVGLCVALFQYVSFYIIFEWLQGTHVLSSSVSFLLTIIVSYLLQRRITFGHTIQTGKRVSPNTRFFVFTLNALVGLFINGGIMFIGVDVFGNSAYITQVFSMGVLALYNFFVYRLLFT